VLRSGKKPQNVMAAGQWREANTASVQWRPGHVPGPFAIDELSNIALGFGMLNASHRRHTRRPAISPKMGWHHRDRSPAHTICAIGHVLRSGKVRILAVRCTISPPAGSQPRELLKPSPYGGPFLGVKLTQLAENLQSWWRMMGRARRLPFPGCSPSTPRAQPWERRCLNNPCRPFGSRQLLINASPGFAKRNQNAAQLSRVQLDPPKHVSRSPIEGIPSEARKRDPCSTMVAGSAIDSHKSEGSRHFIGTRPGTL
jgi:hypothetical protein